MKRPIDWTTIGIIDDAYAAFLRDKTITERVAMAIEFTRVARLELQAAIQRKHPERSHESARKEMCRIMLRKADYFPSAELRKRLKLWNANAPERT